MAEPDSERRDFDQIIRGYGCETCLLLALDFCLSWEMILWMRSGLGFWTKAAWVQPGDWRWRTQLTPE
jgi:hypothetical protein